MGYEIPLPAMNIHESMLFRWTGYELEKPGFADQPAPRRKKLTIEPRLTDQQVEEYLKRLGDALDPRVGLRVSAYSQADAVGATAPVTEPKPCLFFTEQAAGDSEPHWRLYGRLGFGFPKGFIFRNGGRPLIYTGSKNDPVLKSIARLRTLLRQSKDQSACDAVETLARFVKHTAMPPEPNDGADPVGRRAGRSARSGTKRRAAKPKPSPGEFPRHRRIRFLQEREWRLLKGSSQLWRVDEQRTTWFVPEAGKDLQVIIVPSNLIRRLAYEDRRIRGNLTGKTGITAELITIEASRRL